MYWVNGLPLVVAEVKSPTAESGWADAAREINDVYATEYPWFFTPNTFAVASDGLKLRFGAVGAPINLWRRSGPPPMTSTCPGRPTCSAPPSC